MEKQKKKFSLAQKINVLRASVMGANDGILSIAGIVLGVAGASTSNWAILISGLAGMLAGTVSMSMGEYVSVNSQKDSERQAIATVKMALDNDYQAQFNYVENKYRQTGMNQTLAHKATSEMMNDDALTTVVRERYAFDPSKFTSPYAAAIASLISFPLGSLLPLISIFVGPANWHIMTTFVAVIIALAITGYLAAILSKANRFKAVLRNVISGVVTMSVTYLIGALVGLVD
ncbi:VIT1/CCC1 transporter family protein [Fructilactobacillus cliffordii]|uniref:VIT family protein n=1 Tax=Fructilactobacillus cliffordii TaxID=2940299 RepID=A0A9Q8ZPK9_9LACO|nr:VIT family protein [Fructilactobacillus cliffordii]USS89230.1 VIT family protein [Fructilactobacillus cliffordii]